ncbi:MAG: hypothetical protein R6X02_04045 [Enhygromyxa sp.]
MSGSRVHESVPDLERLLARLRRIPCFRVATDEEVERSFAAYQSGDFGRLCEVWAEVTQPTRAALPIGLRTAYAHAGKAPRMVNASVFLVSVRAVLRAGERFREDLSPAVREALHSEFPWLERRHEHIPAGYTPKFEFPRVFAEFVEHGDLDDSRARWQLAVGLNEVQQTCYSRFAAGLFRLPELRRHAARERELAINYFGHWAPRCTKELWRETLWVLDALNAATFELVLGLLVPAFAPIGPLGVRARRAQWEAFVRALDTPQWLEPLPDRKQA